MFFSQRHKLKPVPEYQINSMNNDLRVGLWNAFYCTFMSSFAAPLADNKAHGQQVEFLYELWIYGLKRPSDEFQREDKKIVANFKTHFMSAKWFEVFDLMEYSVGKYYDEDTARDFMAECNFIFEKEFSAYRFVGAIIIPLVDEALIRPPAEDAGQKKEASSYLQPALLVYSQQAVLNKAKVGGG